MGINKELQKMFNEGRMTTFTMEIIKEISNIPDLKRLDSWTVAEGTVGLFHYKDGNAYEIEVRPVSQGLRKGLWGDKIKKRGERQPKPEELSEGRDTNSLADEFETWDENKFAEFAAQKKLTPEEKSTVAQEILRRLENEAKNFEEGKEINESTNTQCDVVKAVDGKWYMGLEDYNEDEEGEQIEGDYRWYGPFISKEATYAYLHKNFANPGGSSEDDSGTMKVPKVNEYGGPPLGYRHGGGSYSNRNLGIPQTPTPAPTPVKPFFFFAGITFTECEHKGDLDNYKEDLRASGATILDSKVNEEAETGYVKISVANAKDFLEKFKKTESFDFSDLRDY